MFSSLFGSVKVSLGGLQSQPSKAKVADQAFDQMERRIAQIHYYFCNADLASEVRQVMTYRKLLELDYFTPQAAQELLRQWIQAEGRVSQKKR